MHYIGLDVLLYIYIYRPSCSLSLAVPSFNCVPPYLSDMYVYTGV